MRTSLAAMGFSSRDSSPRPAGRILRDRDRQRGLGPAHAARARFDWPRRLWDLIVSPGVRGGPRRAGPDPGGARLRPGRREAAGRARRARRPARRARRAGVRRPARQRGALRWAEPRRSRRRARRSRSWPSSGRSCCCSRSGLESTPRDMLAVGIPATRVALAGVVAPMALGFGVGRLMLPGGVVDGARVPRRDARRDLGRHHRARAAGREGDPHAERADHPRRGRDRRRARPRGARDHRRRHPGRGAGARRSACRRSP